ncbi:MAG: hypothetical protein P4L53_26285 [Candidatus Obscuribacterales bacterium]|nr:hypothetical protein [Candidatus Obscuribacterales bacterium]
MAHTTFKTRLLIFLSAAALSSISAAAMAQGTVGNIDSFVSETVKTPFKQTPVHGKIDGIDFKPIMAEIIFMRSDAAPGRTPNGGDKISFKDGGGRQIDVTVYTANKFEDVIYTQAPSPRVPGKTSLGVVIDLRNLNQTDFGIRLSLGKFSEAKTQPVYVIFRLDRDNWLEGYIYAQVHERVLF